MKFVCLIISPYRNNFLESVLSIGNHRRERAAFGAQTPTRRINTYAGVRFPVFTENCRPNIAVQPSVRIGISVEDTFRCFDKRVVVHTASLAVFYGLL